MDKDKDGKSVITFREGPDGITEAVKDGKVIGRVYTSVCMGDDEEHASKKKAGTGKLRGEAE